MIERGPQPEPPEPEAIPEPMGPRPVPDVQPPRRVPDDTAGVNRLGRGVRWSDIVALIEEDRLASEAARREAA